MRYFAIYLICIAYAVVVTSAQLLFGAPSCLSKCDTKPTVTMRLLRQCSCDSSCEERPNTCCRDYWTHCSKSCVRRCGLSYHPLYPCQCHDNCTENCCEDYEDQCKNVDLAGARSLSQATLPPTTRTTTTTPPPPIETGFSFIQGRIIDCPRGIPFVSCPLDPCDEPCERHPDSICIVNQCGTCEAKRFDNVGNLLNCYDSKTHCINGQRKLDCGGLDLCQGQSCPSNPNAICVPNNCGGCYYDFVDEQGNMVNCEEPAPETSFCEDGIERMTCIPLPCDGQICNADITARCRNIVCGECRAEFYNIQGKIVDCSATEPTICNDDCEDDPCEATECDAYPDATCTISKTSQCGKCEASFIYNGKRLRDIDCAIPNRCSKQSLCEWDPCKMYTCPGKEVTCLAQYCNGCNALFFDTDGRRISQDDCFNITLLNLPACSNGKQPEICSADLCLGQRCGSDFSPICKPDPCNNCELRFYNDKNEEMVCKDEIFDECENRNERANCDGSVCRNARCLGNPNVICREDDCNSCNPRFYDIELREVVCEQPDDEPESSGIDTESASLRTLLCSNGKAMRKCQRERSCENQTCASYPGATCRGNPCDDCKPMFFNGMGMRVDCESNSGRSCQRNCGEIRSSTRSCYCDYECSSRGDCCSDYKEECETCVGRCGLEITGANCQCDSECRLNNNCCGDFISVCQPTESCKGKCDSPWDPSANCQCNRRCLQTGNCCVDYIQECA